MGCLCTAALRVPRRCKCWGRKQGGRDGQAFGTARLRFSLLHLLPLCPHRVGTNVFTRLRPRQECSWEQGDSQASDDDDDSASCSFCSADCCSQ